MIHISSDIRNVLGISAQVLPIGEMLHSRIGTLSVTETDYLPDDNAEMLARDCRHRAVAQTSSFGAVAGSARVKHLLAVHCICFELYDSVEFPLGGCAGEIGERGLAEE